MMKFVILCVTWLSFIQQVHTCGGGGGSSSCTYRTCTSSYSGWSPNPSQGNCIWQNNRVKHTIHTHSQGSGCPADSTCTTGTLSRRLCSCRQVINCWWASWGGWTGSISQGTCGRQTRTRQGLSSHTYTHQVNNCNGISSSCPRSSDSQTRTWCNCRKAQSCPSGQWSSWSPSVPNGQCKAQTRYHDKIPQYTYIQQQNHCGGINANCPGRVTEPRTFCRCEYKECNLGGWGIWESHSNNHRNCPQEIRWKRYQSITRFKDASGNCVNIGPKSCPVGSSEVREKDVTCPAVQIPANGKLLDPECGGGKSNCQSSCQMKCDDGYELGGNGLTVCKGNGKWDRILGTCKDITRPTIVCPTIGEYETLPDQDYNMVNLLDATASDNSGLVVKITKSHTSPLKVVAGAPVTVKYTATDQAGNIKWCEIKVTVKDKEPPKMTKKCPENKFISTGTIPTQVLWDEPTCGDNVDKSNIIMVRSHDPGNWFYKGKTDVTYTCRDHTLNSAQCAFSVEVESAKCPASDPPRNGASQCNIRKDGEKEAFICTVACQKGSWFSEGKDIPKVYNFYVCGTDTNWKGQDVFNFAQTDFFVDIPRGTPMWPDCTLGVSPKTAVLDFQIFAGSCKDESVADKLKADFVKGLQNDFVMNSQFCLTDTTNCNVENIVVHCSTRTRRSNNGNRQLVIKFSFSVTDTSINGTADINSTSLSSITSLLNTEKTKLVTKIENVTSVILQDAVKVLPKGSLDLSNSVSVLAKDVMVTCDAGYEYTLVNGSEAGKCLQCMRGTFYNKELKKCSICESGSYQDEEGQLSCKQCPNGTITTGKLTRDAKECIEVCKPGSFSKNGLGNCTSCPIGTYQPHPRSILCQKCPPGKTTDKVGSAVAADCVEPGMSYHIRSEGCDDPGIVPCGTTKIFVNRKDHSPRGRGMNFVAVNAKTGKYTKSVAHDWFADGAACSKSLTWLRALPNNTIVFAAIQDEGSARFNDDCKKALVMIGGKEPFQRRYRASFVLVGYKGTQNATWIKQKKSERRQGPTELSGRILLPN